VSRKRIARRQLGVADAINDQEVKVDDIAEILRIKVVCLEQEEHKPRRRIGQIDD
jgi:hypothetical protein